MLVSWQTPLWNLKEVSHKRRPAPVPRCLRHRPAVSRHPLPLGHLLRGHRRGFDCIHRAQHRRRQALDVHRAARESAACGRGL